ncbi:hypothetical protein [Paraburkholderia youngii]|uniref:hypothetical protein n=1 Tax=Paraburkholderia youngii TaxID=2782701 RepID=UPI003D1A8D34
MDPKLETLINDYGRACRRDGNPAWRSDEGIALRQFLTSDDATPVATVHACDDEISLSTTTAQRKRLAALHGAPLYAGLAEAVSSPMAAHPSTTERPALAADSVAPATAQPDAALENELRFLRRARDGWQDEARILQRRLSEALADNDLLRQRVDRTAWIFQGDGEDHLESLANDTAVVIHAGYLRTLLANERAAAASVVPREVVEWRDLYQAYLHASDAYNARLEFLTKNLPFGAHDDAAQEAMNVAQRKAHAAFKPMLDALTGAVAAPDDEERVLIHETYTGQNGWLRVSAQEYKDAEDKYERRVRYAQADEAAAYGLPDIGEFDLLVDDYQCAQKDGTPDTRAAARIALNAAYRKALKLATGHPGHAFTRGLASGLDRAATVIETTRESSTIVEGEEQRCLRFGKDTDDMSGRTWAGGIRKLIPVGALLPYTTATALAHVAQLCAEEVSHEAA